MVAELINLTEASYVTKISGLRSMKEDIPYFDHTIKSSACRKFTLLDFCHANKSLNSNKCRKRKTQRECLFRTLCLNIAKHLIRISNKN